MSPEGDFFIRALATCVGALVAFGLAGVREKWKEHQQQIEQFKTAIFLLIRQRMLLREIREQRLQPFREHPLGVYAVPPVLTPPPADTLEVVPLAFLLAKGESETINHMMMADSKYRTIRSLIEARNKVHYNLQDRPLPASSDYSRGRGCSDWRMSLLHLRNDAGHGGAAV